MIRRNSFQSRHLRGKSFSIDLVSRVEVKITISKNCLVICEGFEPHILFLYVDIVEKCPREEAFEAALDESSCHLVAALFNFERKQEENQEKMGGRVSETIYCCRCVCNLEENRVRACIFHGHGICTTSFVPRDATKSVVRLECYSPKYFIKTVKIKFTQLVTQRQD